MSRIVFKLVAFLLLGTIANIAVAWTIAITIDTRWTTTVVGDDQIGGNRWCGMRWMRFGSYEFYSEWRSASWGDQIIHAGPSPDTVIPNWARDLKPPQYREPLPDGYWSYASGVSRGYPLKCFHARTDGRSDAGKPRENPTNRGGIVLTQMPWTDGPSYRYPRVLPYSPIWTAVAFNTIFYAAMLWLLLAAPGFVRRRIRARRGQCPACAYPVGASEVCTECGKPVQSP